MRFFLLFVFLFSQNILLSQEVQINILPILPPLEVVKKLSRGNTSFDVEYYFRKNDEDDRQNAHSILKHNQLAKNFGEYGYLLGPRFYSVELLPGKQLTSPYPYFLDDEYIGSNIELLKNKILSAKMIGGMGPKTFEALQKLPDLKETYLDGICH